MYSQMHKMCFIHERKSKGIQIKLRCIPFYSLFSTVGEMGIGQIFRVGEMGIGQVF